VADGRQGRRERLLPRSLERRGIGIQAQQAFILALLDPPLRRLALELAPLFFVGRLLVPRSAPSETMRRNEPSRLRSVCRRRIPRARGRR
jgi:hypothetical protein